MKKILLFLCLGAATGASAQGWTTIPSGTMSNLTSCSFGDASTFYAAGNWAVDSATILKSTDAGLTFYHLSTAFLPAGHLVGGVHFKTADTGFISSALYSASATPPWSTGMLYRTVNGGASWSAVITGMSTPFSSVCFPSAGVGYGCGSNSGTPVFQRSTDGGATWTSIYSGTASLNLGQLFMVDNNTGFVVGQDATTHVAALVKITGGVVSGVSTFSAYTSFSGVYFSSATTGYVTAGTSGTSPAFYVLKTTDGGTTWTPVYTSGYNYEVCMKFDGTAGYAVGGNTINTSDGGVTWSLTAGMPSGGGSPSAMDIRNHVRIIVGEAGIIYRQVGASAVSQAAVPHGGLRVFPNPATAQAHLVFDKEQEDAVISINDAAGRSIYQRIFTGRELTIDQQGMAPGLYTVQVTSKDGISCTRLEVQ